MELDKKTVAGAAAAVAVGAIGAAIAYKTLGNKGPEGNKRRQKRANATPAAPTGPINVNQAQRDELMSLKHIGKARAKRILASRPFKSVEDLVSRGILPEEVLVRHRDRLTV